MKELKIPTIEINGHTISLRLTHKRLRKLFAVLGMSVSGLARAAVDADYGVCCDVLRVCYCEELHVPLMDAEAFDELLEPLHPGDILTAGIDAVTAAFGQAEDGEEGENPPAAARNGLSG